MARRPRSHRAGAVLIFLLLVVSAFATVVATAFPARGASGAPANSLLYDDFTHDTSLNTSLWQVNGPVGMVFGPDEVGINMVTLVPAFSSSGMMIDQVNESQEEGTIQSDANFTPPFTATAMVEGTISNGHTFGFAISSANASSGVTIYGNLNPMNCSHLSDCGDPTTCGISFNSSISANQCYYGIDAKVGTNGSSWTHHAKLFLTPSVNVTYTLQISINASGNAWYAVSQSGQVLGAGNEQVGTGPFWLILYQGEGSPVEHPGPNQAYWLSASVTPVATTFSTTSTLSTTSTTPVQSTSSIPNIVWLILIAVVLILFLIILLWYRRRNLTIRVQDSRSLSPVIGATVSADGPEKLMGYTDKDGKITFKGVKKGDYYIKAEAKEFVASTPVKVEVKKTTEYIVKLERSTYGASAVAGSNARPAVPGGEVMGPSEIKPGLQEPGVTAQTPGPQPSEPRATVTRPIEQGSAPAVVQPVPSTSPSDQLGEVEVEGFGGGRISEIIKTFRAKGAISPETALTAEELGLSRLFVRIMKRRMGRTRIFVEVNGRYYLNQKALQEMQ